MALAAGGAASARRKWPIAGHLESGRSGRSERIGERVESFERLVVSQRRLWAGQVAWPVWMPCTCKMLHSAVQQDSLSDGDEASLHHCCPVNAQQW